MNWQLFPQFLVTGLLTGGVYALIALGLVLIYKSSRIFNFAQGHILMIGGFVTWWFMVRAGWPLWSSALAALVVAVLLGLVIERLALRPLIGQPILSTILMTLALSQFLQGVAILIWGAQRQAFPEFIPLQPVVLGPVRLKLNLLISSGVALLGFVVFALFFKLTKAGLAMRATAEDHQLAQSVGLSVRRIFGLAWAIAAVVATAGGILLGSISGIDPNLALVAFKAFPAVLFGGLESVPGAIVGGLTVGVVESLVAGLPRNPAIRELGLAHIASYMVMLLVLLFKPDGLFGLKRIERI